MTVPLSDTRLAEIRARKAAATGGGRWILLAGRSADEYRVKAIIGEDEVVVGTLDFGAGPAARDDKTLIVNAGRDIAALLAEVDRLRSEFREAMDNYHGEHAFVRKQQGELAEARAENEILRAAIQRHCTCSRSQGLHSKTCQAYIPGHELASPALAARRLREEWGHLAAASAGSGAGQ